MRNSDPVEDLTSSLEAADLVGKHQTNTLIQICICAQNKFFFFASFIMQKTSNTSDAHVIRHAIPMHTNNLRKS